jgi:hypothetical protein
VKTRLVITALIALVPLAVSASDAVLPVSCAFPAVQIKPVDTNLTAKGYGSGFFLRTTNALFLVTAKHVLFNVSNPIVRLHSALALCLSLGPETDPKPSSWIFHTLRCLKDNELRYVPNHDVAVARLRKIPSDIKKIELKESRYIKLIWGNNIASPMHAQDSRTLSQLVVYSDILLFGYPASATVLPVMDRSAPVGRKGIVAGINLDHGSIAVGCYSFIGDSGGPVLTIEAEPSGELAFPIIGLLSECVPGRKLLKDEPFWYLNPPFTNATYSIVEPMDEILELIRQFPP